MFKKAILVIGILVSTLLFATPVLAGDPNVTVTVTGAAPDVTVNTGAGSTVSVNGAGLVNSQSLSDALHPTAYEDPWMSQGEFRRWYQANMPQLLDQVSSQGSNLGVLQEALAKDIDLDMFQDKAIKDIIQALNDNDKAHEAETADLKRQIADNLIMIDAVNQQMTDNQAEYVEYKATMSQNLENLANYNNKLQWEIIALAVGSLVLFGVAVCFAFGGFGGALVSGISRIK